MQEWKELEDALDPKYQTLYHSLSVKIGDKKAQREVWIMHTHEILQVLAKRHNFIYRRNKW
jgi:hypothetical protein